MKIKKIKPKTIGLINFPSIKLRLIQALLNGSKIIGLIIEISKVKALSPKKLNAKKRKFIKKK